MPGAGASPKHNSLLAWSSESMGGGGQTDPELGLAFA